MALKAGRRGLNKRLVDAFGNFNGEAPSGEYYTKQQTDNKFETKTHVNNTFQKKMLELPIETLMGSKLTVEDSLDSLNEIQKTRQPKTLEVPIEMLSGSKLTVEDALQGLNSEKLDSSDVNDWSTQRIDYTVEIEGESTTLGSIELHQNIKTGIVCVEFSSSSINIPVGNYDFDLKPYLLKSVKFTIHNAMRGNNNLIGISNNGILELRISTSGSWLFGSVHNYFTI